ncbi:MAG TPA: GIY-YIG nuclease family protein [Burkholderiales bacterium]|jgi:putative endonuclease
MPKGQYFVYILASKSRRLYVGVTNDLERRVYEHKQKLADGFTRQYRIDRLVHYEETSDVLAAIEREKQIKGWLREKKLALIESGNPTWRDLSNEWYKGNSEAHSPRNSS